MTDSATVWQQVHTAIQKLLVLEVDLGMTFANAAISAQSTQERMRNRQLARRAYDSGRKWMARARFTCEDTRTYNGKLRRLRLTLNRLGDPIQDSYCDDLTLL